ncbi:MAG: hypothetical protein ACLR23_20440 [Clostridia bacterium]
MWIYTVQVDSMMCGMCESPVNDAVRKALPVKKVSSSRSKRKPRWFQRPPWPRTSCGRPFPPRAMGYCPYSLPLMRERGCSPLESSAMLNAMRS